jgi:hypothetical protein
MPRRQKTLMVHLKVHSDCLDGFMQYNPIINDPTPVDTTSTLPYQTFTQEPAKEVPGITTTGGRNEVMECNNNYKDIKNYPKTAKAVCWWDGHPFSFKPCFIPKNIRTQSHITGDIVYDVYGNFCSPECALAYLENERNIDPEVRWNRISMLHEMTRRVINEAADRIQPAMPRWTLTEYGGPLSIEKYRDSNTNPSVRCDVIYPPITVEVPQIQLTSNDFVVKRPKKVVIDEERFAKAEENLRKISSINLDKPKQDLRKGGILDMMNIRIPNSETMSSSFNASAVI